MVNNVQTDRTTTQDHALAPAHCAFALEVSALSPLRSVRDRLSWGLPCRVIYFWVGLSGSFAKTLYERQSSWPHAAERQHQQPWSPPPPSPRSNGWRGSVRFADQEQHQQRHRSHDHGCDGHYQQEAPRRPIEPTCLKPPPVPQDERGDSSVVDTRNVAVIAHVDHGKTTICDGLLQRAGVLAADRAGDQDRGRELDTNEIERDRGITIKSTGITMSYELPEDIFLQSDTQAQKRFSSEKLSSVQMTARRMTLNLIDSPGHVDFSGEVTSALRMADGCLVVVDAVSGKSVQTETVLLQALRERVKPVLYINKVDRLILDLQLNAEDIFDRLEKVVNQVNETIALHQADDLPDQSVSFEAGSVAFGSGYFQWSASLDTFAKLLRRSSSHGSVMKKLARRSTFASSVLGPIIKIHQELGLVPCQEQHSEVNEEWLTKFSARIVRLGRRPLGRVKDVVALPPRKMLKALMSAFLPPADPILHMMLVHLPSPIEAQSHRMKALYDRDGDAVLPQLEHCDPEAPIMLYVSKMVHGSEFGSKHGGSGLLAVCRVYSGTVTSGKICRVVGLTTTVRIGKVMQCVGKKVRTIESVVAGQLAVITGVSDILKKSGTLSTFEDSGGIKPMSFSVAPVVQKSISPLDPKNLKKMVAAAKSMTASDPTALFYVDHGTGEHVLAGAGELHLEVLVNTLERSHGLSVKLSDPMVNFRESITKASSDSALKKSSNKLNRVWFTASPLSTKLVNALEGGELGTGGDMATLSKQLQQFGWDKHAAGRVWALAPELAHSGEGSGAVSGLSCILVNSTVAIQIPSDVRDTIIAGFKQVVRDGLLAGSPIRGVRFDLVDAKFHGESTHRSSAQLLPAAKSAMRGAMMKASPCLVEPFFVVDISGKPGSINAAYNVLTGRRRGRILDSGGVQSSGMDSIRAEVPVRLSFGLTDEIRGATSGAGFVSTSFGGWQNVLGDPTNQDGGEARQLIESQRLAKRLPKPVPIVSDFVDKL